MSAGAESREASVVRPLAGVTGPSLDYPATRGATLPAACLSTSPPPPGHGGLLGRAGRRGESGSCTIVRKAASQLGAPQLLPGCQEGRIHSHPLGFKVYRKTDRFRFYFKHLKSVLAQLLALKLFSRPTLEF